MLSLVRADGCGADILRGVYYALVLTPWNLAVSNTNVKNKATVDAPWVCYIHTPPLCLLAIGVSFCTNGNIGIYCGVLYINISAWGSALLVSTFGFCQNLKE